MDDRLLSVPEVAEVLGVSPRTVWHLIEDGELRSVKIRSCRRIAASEVFEFVAVATEA